MDGLDAELALRIALAARTMGSVSTQQLLNALIHCVGEPLSERRLLRLRAKNLRAQLGKVDNNAFQQAWNLLKKRQFSDEVSAAPLPDTVMRISSDKRSVRIACASEGGERVDGSFTSCRRFLVYEVSPTDIHLVDVRAVPQLLAGQDRYLQRLQLIEDCQLLYALAIGGIAAARVVRSGVHPVKLEFPSQARNVARDLQSVLAGCPPPWLAKIMGSSPEDRVRFHGESGS